MKIDQFFKSLLPSFSKDTVLEDCRITRGEIKETVHPAYTEAVKLMKNWKFKSADVESLGKQFSSLVKRTHGNMVVTIEQKLPDVLTNLDEVEELIKANYNEEVAAGGVTYLKAQLLQFVEAASFFAKYSRALLNFIYVHESAPFIKETDEQYDAVQESLVPAEIAYIQNNFSSFCVVLNALSGAEGDIKKALGEVPDIVITDDNVQTLPHSVGQAKLDPLKFGFIPVFLNPIYHVRMAIAEWQVEQYKLAQRELQMLQMRKLNLEKLQQGQPNPVLQQKLGETERAIHGLKAKLAKMERDYA
jgi:hypothetical protein